MMMYDGMQEEDYEKLHTCKGWYLKKYDEITWLTLDFDTGKLK